ncbi:MAG TPA: hypothetical protein VGD59_14605 [Acidisarcina sp.]
MRIAGLMLLMAGWALVVLALILLPATAARSAFLGAGFAVEMIGLVLAMRRQLPPSEDTA